MDVIRRRASPRNGVVAGSVWESRMKSDEVKGGIKVFNGEEVSEVVGGGGSDNGHNIYRRLKRNQNGGVAGKRKTWNERSPFQMRKTRSELKKLSNESCKELTVSVDSIEKNPTQIRKTRSETHRVSDDSCKELGVFDDVNEKSPIELRKTKSDSYSVLAEPSKELQISTVKTMSRSVSNVSQVNSPQRLGVDDDGIDADGEDEGEDEEDDMEIEVEKKSYDVKEVNIAEEKPISISQQKLKEVEEGEEGEEEEEEEEKKVYQIPENPIPISENVNEKSSPVIDRPVIDLPKPKKVLNEEKRVHQIHQKPKRIFSKVNKQPSPVSITPLIDPSLRKPPPISEVFDRSPERTPNNLQNLVDLVMWRDVSKSAFVFGVGTFYLLSSSFTKDLNFSLISAISYMGLVYLAAIFCYKSILCRGATDMDDSNEEYIVGEQEAIWVLKFILPYLNEFLLKLRSIFSGDPATTMKLAVLLFVLARCGSSITVWKMAKLGFFAVFTVPKVCSSYSNQLTAYGKFWIGRFRDAWNSCTHKKAVAAAVFTLVWNFSSVVARVWAVFMLVVAVRYYQQSLLSEDWGVEREDSGWREGGECGEQRQEHDGPTTIVKEKKGC
ncbi:reticulon-like protein B21 isoform X2 [Telopea speciosissima]|uniref:reticulon-like protein B21 isoform X2 n=1 Tax=Telopea speciosissima TaxID=54955 RepID=UPI001CC73396|nr:reticulon-like protein B21 isoform X2 [Telopea speciosissima]